MSVDIDPRKKYRIDVIDKFKSYALRYCINGNISINYFVRHCAVKVKYNGYSLSDTALLNILVNNFYGSTLKTIRVLIKIMEEYPLKSSTYIKLKNPNILMYSRAIPDEELKIAVCDKFRSYVSSTIEVYHIHNLKEFFKSVIEPLYDVNLTIGTLYKIMKGKNNINYNTLTNLNKIMELLPLEGKDE